MSSAVIEARGLVKNYWMEGKTVEVLRGAELTVREGEVVALVGKSGAGKSTLLHVLGTLDVPTAGAVLFHFALMQELPATSYLTRADKLMLGVYVSLALGMVSTWWMFLVKEHNVPVVFKVARMAVPLLSSVTMALACLV